MEIGEKEEILMRVGDKIIEWSYYGWSDDKGKFYSEHTVIRITPTGIIVTDTGLNLNENLRPRGKYSSSYRDSNFVPWSEEIEQEMQLQKKKDEISNLLKEINVYKLNSEHTNDMLELLKKINSTQPTKK